MANAPTSSEVRFRYQNPGAHMAKKSGKKGGGKKGGGSRSSSRRSSGKGGHKGTRRRRNPRNDYMSRAGRLAGLAIATLGAGALVIVGQSRFQPGTAISQYGIPLVGFGLGVALARKSPTIGVGIAAGSAAAPFVLPLASKVAGMLPAATTTTTTATTTSGLRAVSRALLNPHMMGAVQQRIGAVSRAYAY